MDVGEICMGSEDAIISFHSDLLETSEVKPPGIQQKAAYYPLLSVLWRI